MVSSKVGAPVKGDDFFDRELEQERLWEYLESDDVLLLAPRRVGKTSLMFRLKDTAAKEGFEAAYLSVASATSEVVFVRKLYEAMKELDSAKGLAKISQHRFARQSGRFWKRINKISLLQAGLELEPEDPWKEVGASLAEALDKVDGRRLLLVDEVPVFVLELFRQDPSGNRARRFLSWFRDLRQAPERQGRLRWLLAGSIGLDTVTARLRISDTINDLFLVHLGAFDRPTSQHLLAELSQSYDFPLSEALVEKILDRVGWLIPYYLQLVFRELRAAAGSGSGSGDEHSSRVGSEGRVDEGLLNKVFEDLMSPAKKNYFGYWRQRLEEELGKPEAGHATHLLNAICLDPDGMDRALLSQKLSELISDVHRREKQLSYLLDVLQGDGYLVQERERYRFRSPLLRELWQKRVAP